MDLSAFVAALASIEHADVRDGEGGLVLVRLSYPSGESHEHQLQSQYDVAHVGLALAHLATLDAPGQLTGRGDHSAIDLLYRPHASL